MTLLGISEKLERLISKLPEPLRKPLLREITPVKELFLQQRPPRLLFLGERSVEQGVVINALFGCEVMMPDPGQAGTGSWQSVSRAGRGTLQFLDGRNPANLRRIQSSLGAELPDLVIFLARQGESFQFELSQTGEQAETLMGLIGERQEAQLPVIGLLVMNAAAPDESGKEATQEKEALGAVGALGEALGALPLIKKSLIETTPLFPPIQSHGSHGTYATYATYATCATCESQPAGFPAQERNLNPIAEVVAFALPNEAKLEMARLSGVRSIQEHIAKILVRSMTAASGAIGAQPIPLADFPILTTLQAMTVAGIMVVSGREMTIKLATEFIAALGANIGVGLVFREGARALLKLFPGWGNAISGAIASAGTYAVGKAATAYFIQGASLKEARKLFRLKSAIDQKPLGR